MPSSVGDRLSLTYEVVHFALTPIGPGLATPAHGVTRKTIWSRWSSAAPPATSGTSGRSRARRRTRRTRSRTSCTGGSAPGRCRWPRRSSGSPPTGPPPPAERPPPRHRVGARLRRRRIAAEASATYPLTPGAVTECVTRGEVARLGSVRRDRTRAPRRRLAQVAVDGGAGDAELGGYLGDGVLALALGVAFVVHLLCELGLARSELGLLTTAPRPARSPVGAARGLANLDRVLETTRKGPPPRVGWSRPRIRVATAGTGRRAAAPAPAAPARPLGRAAAAGGQCSSDGSGGSARLSWTRPARASSSRVAMAVSTGSRSASSGSGSRSPARTRRSTPTSAAQSSVSA